MRSLEIRHSPNLFSLGEQIVNLLEKYISDFDKDLVLCALFISSMGERLLGREIPLFEKTDEQRLEEYKAFRDYFGPSIPPESYLALEEAFLLPIALNNPKCFPEPVQTVMSALAEKKRREALIFRGIEYVDFVMHAQDQFPKREAVDALYELLKVAMPILDEVRDKVPGFGEEVWTLEQMVLCSNFMARYEKMKSETETN